MFCLGQEDQTQEIEGEVKITPFNMKEEMEEGNFDKDGHYIPNKKAKDEVRDNWLDNIDWVKIDSKTSGNALTQSDEETENLKEITPFNELSAYKEILELLLPGETILKALKRYGGSKTLTASQRWKKKKEGKEVDASGSQQDKIDKLTGLADNILNKMGNMDIYQDTFESIRFKIQQAKTASVPEPDQDMFGADFIDKSNPKSAPDGTEEPSAKKVRFDADGKPQEEEETLTPEVRWEFKWENANTAEIHGPHSTREMLNWVNEGYFEAGVWVRRVGQQGEFSNSRRMDFDLYL